MGLFFLYFIPLEIPLLSFIFISVLQAVLFIKKFLFEPDILFGSWSGTFNFLRCCPGLLGCIYRILQFACPVRMIRNTAAACQSQENYGHMPAMLGPERVKFHREQR